MSMVRNMRHTCGYLLLRFPRKSSAIAHIKLEARRPVMPQHPNSTLAIHSPPHPIPWRMLASSALLASILGSVSAATAQLEDRDFLLDPSLLLPGRSTCSLLAGINPFTPTSCTNTTVENDLCCFNAPGGHFLQTQFWDYESPLKWAGPNDSWTVHGLWPDHCDGTYDQYCSSAREVKNITQVLQVKGENRLLEWMGEYWKDNTGNDESFWEHEFNKHATCISTLDPKCIRNYQSGDDVVIFIKRTISLFQLLPTHFFLAARGIVPSTTKQYKLADIQQAIVSATGKKPTIGCDGPGKTFLHEMWYHYLTRGSVIDGVFLHADADSSNSCADTVWYWPKGVPTPSSTPTSTSSSAASSTPTSTVDKGTIQVYTSKGTNVGCVLSKGTWSQQTCATFRPSAGSTIGTFTYTSSKGLCAVDATNGTLVCSADITTGSEFTNSTISIGSLLAYDASTSFSADVVPTGTIQSTIYSGGDHAQGITLVYMRA